MICMREQEGGGSPVVVNQLSYVCESGSRGATRDCLYWRYIQSDGYYFFFPGFVFNCNLTGHTPNFVVVVFSIHLGLPLSSFFFFLPSFLPSSGNKEETARKKKEETRNSNHLTRGSPLRALAAPLSRLSSLSRGNRIGA